jgi:hypothetical protein
MNDRDRRRYEMQVRVVQFGTDNSADFTGIATAKFAELEGLVDEIEAESAQQQSGFGESAQQHEVKDTARENLRDEMSAIARTARSMEYAFDGISELFSFQRNLPDADLLARARAFLLDIPNHKPNFIAYGLPALFDANLLVAADVFEGTFTFVSAATEEHVEATANIGAKIREGMIIVRTLNGIVRNVYSGNPGKLAAWTAASHVESDPQKAPPPAPPPTP